MNGLINTWVGYFDRSYQQAKEAILNRLGIVAPELSDHTESNPLIILLDIFLGIAELLHYYIDNVAREVYLHSARQYRSAQKVAKSFNYRLKGYSSSSAVVRFAVQDPATAVITVPQGTRVSAGEIPYETVASGVIPIGGTSVDVVVIQKTAAQLSYTSDGQPNQRVALSEDTVDLSVAVAVDGIQYSFRDDLFLSSATDNHFTTEIGEDRIFYVVFGDGVDGRIPIVDANVVINYDTSLGSIGNVPVGEIDTLESQIVADQGVEVANIEDATGGAEIESLQRLKKVIPASLRTLNRAVSLSDYRDIAESVNGVAQAFPVYDCGAAVDLYVVPTGLGAATSVLRQSVREAFNDETALILLDVNVLSAGRIAALIVADVQVLPVFNRQVVSDRVRENLKAFLSSDTQEVSGSVRIGDIYEVMQNTEGVDYSELRLLSVVPEATIVDGINVLNWNRELLPASEFQTSWSITIISANTYALRKQNVLVNNYQFGEQVVLPEITLNVIDEGYSLGDSWEFVTYRYNGSIELNEPSIVTLQDANLTLNVTGGV